MDSNDALTVLAAFFHSVCQLHCPGRVHPACIFHKDEHFYGLARNEEFNCS